MSEQLNFFASLDFPGRTTLGLDEIAERVGCTRQHLLNQIDEGKFTGLNIASQTTARRAMRVPIECYRSWVLACLTGPVDFKMRFLRDLPAAARRQLIQELNTSLTTHP
jgi:hypothetical protein